MASPASKRLEGKTILITGASSGIGRSTAYEFARTCPNLRLILIARRLEALQKVATDINKEVGAGVEIYCHAMDVGKPEDIDAFLPSLPEEFRNIDVLFNNAYVPKYTVCVIVADCKKRPGKRWHDWKSTSPKRTYR